MKISRTRLRRIIREEKTRLLTEVGHSSDLERRGHYELRDEIEAEKKAFMAKELTHWYDEFSPEDDGQADLIEDHISDCYDAIYEALMETTR